MCETKQNISNDKGKVTVDQLKFNPGKSNTS